MIKRFKSHIKDRMPEILASELIVGVSGGIDSMVLLSLLKALDMNILVAHCNFHLRGEESDKDAAFVEEYCAKNNIRFVKKDFKPEEVKTGSVQLKARELRYAWFHELSEQNNGAFILTAHQRDDLIETFFINLTRGAGIKGLSGIPEIRHQIRRPLLLFSREEIQEYALKEGVQYREDETNNTDVYLRNYIRHHVLPVLRKVEPSFDKQATKSIGFVSDAAESWMEMSDKNFGYIEEALSGRVEIAVDNIGTSEKWLLTGQLVEMGFSSDQIGKIFNSIGSSGLRFQTNDLELLVDREKLVIYPIGFQDFDNWQVKVNKDENHVAVPYGIIRLEKISIENYKSGSFEKGDDCLLLDFDTIPDELVIRNWQEGDVFRPFGMKGRKKVSDFFIDRKVPLDKKSLYPMLIGGDTIYAICGLEIADKVKIGSSTNTVLLICIEYNKS